MKPFLGTDLTQNKKNDRLNGEEFIVMTASPENSRAVDGSAEKTESFLKKSKLPLAVRIINYILGIAGVVIAAGIVRAITDSDGELTLKDAYVSLPWLFWVGGICLIAFAAISLAAKLKERRVLLSPEAQFALSEAQKASSDVLAEFGVPEFAPAVDILMFKYKNEDGKIIPKTPALASGAYVNLEMRLFVKDGELRLADLEAVYAFPLSQLTAIRTVNKKISIPVWNKELSVKDAPYREYKLSVNDSGQIFFKPYHILEVNSYGEIYGIYFPSYELPAFEELTGLRAEPDKKGKDSEDGQEDTDFPYGENE